MKIGTFGAHVNASSLTTVSPASSTRRRAMLALAAMAALTWAPLAQAQSPEPDAPAQAATAETGAETGAGDDASAETPATPPADDASAETPADASVAGPPAIAAPSGPAVVTSPEREAFDAAVREATEGDRQRLTQTFQRLQSDADVGVYATHNLGVIAWERGDAEEARSLFADALRREPGFGPSLVALVRDHLSRGEVQQAETLINAQRTQSEDASGVRAAALFVTLYRQNWAGVVRDTRSVLIDNPNDIDAHFALAMAYLAMGRTELADYVLNMAARRAPYRADLAYGQARVALARGNTVDAEAKLREAITRAPAFPEASIDLSAILLAKMNYEPVVSAMEQVTRVVPMLPAAWITLGSGLKGMRRYDEAKAAFERALELDPQSYAAVFNLGILYLDVQDFEGLAQLERMERVKEYFARYRTLRGTIDDADPVVAYEAYVADEIAMQEELARQAEEEAERARRRAEREAAEQAAEGDEPHDGGEETGDDDWDDWDDW